MSSSSIGYITTLESFLSRWFPTIKLLKSYDTDVIEVWLPENPQAKIAETAVDEAWERNRW